MRGKILRISLYASPTDRGALLGQGLQAYASSKDLRWQVHAYDAALVLYRDRAGRPDDVIVLAVNDNRIASSVQRMLEVPCLHVGSAPGQIRFDPQAVARAAAQHLHDCGWRRAAIWPGTGSGESERDERDAAFRAAFARLGGTVSVLDRMYDDLQAQREPHRYLRPLAEMPAGTALFASHMGLALWLAGALRSLGRDIPGEVGLITCGPESAPVSATAEFSHVRTPDRLLAEQVALTIHRWSSSGVWAPGPALRPLGVEVRASTRPRPPTDPLLRRALAIIEAHLPVGIDAIALAEALAVSPDTLARHCRKAGLGPPRQLIVQRRLQVAESLLAERPELAIGEIARRCGWCNASHLAKAFRTGYGVTPAIFRQGGC